MFQVAYSSDNPISGITVHVISIHCNFHCIQAEKIAQTVTISGNSVNINIDRKFNSKF